MYEEVYCHVCGNLVCQSCGCCCSVSCDQCSCPDVAEDRENWLEADKEDREGLQDLADHFEEYGDE